MSLFWRVFVTNAALFVGATALLVATPLTVSWPVAVTEVVVLAVGVAAMLVANAVLLRPAFAPLERLAGHMGQVDLLRPGQRFTEPGRGEVAALVGAFNEMLERLEAERLESGRRALAAQEAERRRVAAGLHDEVGQTMTAVLMLLQRLRDADDRGGPADAAVRGAMLHEAQESVRTGLDEVRRIAQELRPEMLEELGLVSALRAQAAAFTRRTGVTVDQHLARDLPAISPVAELAVYRIVQESLTNVARHANADRVELSLVAGAGGAVTLSVVDNGVGFPQDLAEGGGLRGMRERAVIIGARLSLQNGPAGGARVRLDLPPAVEGTSR